MVSLLIDGDVLLYRCLFRLVSNGQVPDHAVDVYEEFQIEVERWVNRFKAGYLYSDPDIRDVNLYISPDKTFRHDIHPGYKTTRRKQDRPPWYDYAREAIWNLENCTSMCFPYLEADDALGIVATNPYFCPQSVIVTIDKDLNQIPGYHYNPMKDEHYYVTDDEASYFMRQQWLTGDSGDDIPGLPGIGPKRAQRILAPFWCKDTNRFDWNRADWAIRKTYIDRGFSSAYCEQQRTLVEILQYSHFNCISDGAIINTATATLFT